MPRAEDWRYEVISGEVRLSYRPRPLFFSRATIRATQDRDEVLIAVECDRCGQPLARLETGSELVAPLAEVMGWGTVFRAPGGQRGEPAHHPPETSHS